MAGGKHRSAGRVFHEVRKGTLLTEDERHTAARLKRQRFSYAEIARAIGRSIPDVQAFLDSPEAAFA